MRDLKNDILQAERKSPSKFVSSVGTANERSIVVKTTIEVPSKEKSEDHPKELLDKEFLEKIDKLLKHTLNEYNFPSPIIAKLNLSNFNIEINGHKKQIFNVQGYTSFLNSIINVIQTVLIRERCIQP